jgi:hypothetical protein
VLLDRNLPQALHRLPDNARSRSKITSKGTKSGWRTILKLTRWACSTNPSAWSERQVLLDRNLTLVLHRLPDKGVEMRAKLAPLIELAPVDVQNDRFCFVYQSSLTDI